MESKLSLNTCIHTPTFYYFSNNFDVGRWISGFEGKNIYLDSLADGRRKLECSVSSCGWDQWYHSTQESDKHRIINISSY